MPNQTPDKLVRWWLKILLVVVILVTPPVVIISDVYINPGRDWKFHIVRQNAQFHSMAAALELFNNAFEGYPPSDANDPAGQPYCGAMKLAEAVTGRDLLGFHGESAFRADGKDANGIAPIYKPTNLSLRKGPYMPPDCADCPTLAEIFARENTGPFNPENRVLCDIYTNRLKTGRKIGMPVLYYKADTSRTSHDAEDPNNPDNIYDYRDNHALLALGVPGDPTAVHPLFADPKLFYKMTKSDKITTSVRPVHADTFILISAGPDRFYGTKDDICNFEFKFPKD
ncbi:MAG: hypothetical protein JW720_10005 [Sedimentisphaerales bacterium]|nr:hypothetical protein [Sedimentisphaerales bacterium]